jgi:tyrosinase
MKAPYFTAASLLSSVACASPVFIEGTHGIALRQVPGSYYPITGATGGVFARLEIRELERAGGEMWNLFLLALAEFQAMDQNAIDSYFQIAGVSVTSYVTAKVLIFLRSPRNAMVCSPAEADSDPHADIDEDRTAWDGVGGRLEDDGEGGRKLPDMGYCPHGQVLFGTWHRPYLILFEVCTLLLVTFSIHTNE